MKKNLNESQELAVHEAKNAFVLAGAGTGKTSVLTHRIVRLVEEGVPMQKILAVTFTNKAAREMKSRIKDMLEGQSMSDAWVGTFHGICHRILRMYWQEAGLVKGFTIMAEADQLSLIKRTIMWESGEPKDEDVKGIQSFINKEKDKGKRPKDIVVKPKDAIRANFKKWYEHYETRCAIEGVVDFAELMLRVFELWRDNKSIRESFQKKFDHILVDEFQDTNPLQYAWLNGLKRKENVFFAVGDDAQSIYGFRGAVIENVQKFIKDYDAKLIKLEQNYRSTKPILSVANAALSMAEGVIEKNLFTTKQGRKKPKVIGVATSREEAKQVRKMMEEAHANGTPYSEMAVLYRTNALSRAFESECAQHRIPAKVFGGMRFYERQEIKHALAYLKLMASPQDDGAFLRIINIPPRGIGLTAMDNYIPEVKQTESLYEALIPERMTCVSKKSKEAFLSFRATIEDLKREFASGGLLLSEKVRMLMQRSGLVEWYKKLVAEGKEDRDRLENLTELVEAAKSFEEEFPAASIEDFLSMSMLESSANTPEKEGDTEYVSLMTIHAAKGLEFECVWVAGVEEGLLPHIRSVEEKNVEEERRLWYVAMTRAKTSLMLTVSESRESYYAVEASVPSSFLKELPRGSSLFDYEGSPGIKRKLKWQ
jgi:DNA helicase II / ATP-dependent DNA helicase PcrA